MANSEDFISMLEALKIELEISHLEREKNLKRELEEKMEERINQIKENNEKKSEAHFLIEDFENAPRIASRQNKTKTKFACLTRCIQRFGKFRPMAEINTGTLFLHSVAKVVDDKTNMLKKIITALGALIISSLQHFFLILVIIEASYPTCNLMADCSSGTFCGMDGRYFSHPVCLDCSRVDTFEHLFTNNICQNRYPEYPWEISNSVNVEPDTDKYLRECLAFKFCEESDLDASTNFRGQCDFTVLNMKKLNLGSYLLIGFLSLLYVLPVIEDIDEAAIEEMILDHHTGKAHSVSTEIVRLAIRPRKFLLPLLATAATGILIITDEISTKNIILNFLSITFILEADNMMGALFLREHNLILMEKSVENIQIEDLPNAHTAFLWSRSKGFICIFLLFVGSAFIDKALGNCEDIVNVIITIQAYYLVIWMSLKFFFYVCMKQGDERFSLRFLRALIDMSRNILAIGVVVIFTLFLIQIINTKFVDTFAFMLLGFAFSVIIHVILLTLKVRYDNDVDNWQLLS